MNKRIISLLFLFLISLALVSCGTKTNKVTNQIKNGGFESADLSGWTIEYGNAFSNQSISSRKTFSYASDPNHCEIPINHTGNWYLAGKGFDLRIPNSATGAIRSSNFYLQEDGIIKVKIAGGALSNGKGTSVPMKEEEKICYVGVYLAKDDRMIAKITNEYFVEHTEDYVVLDKYTLGVYNTDNFYEYSVDLQAYVKEELYLRIVDNDTSYYYGYISVDDIRIGEDAEPQSEGDYFVKVTDYTTEVSSPSPNEIKNGGFETGSLAGWTVVSGDAFSNEGVNPAPDWWNEGITYSRDGEYHYGMYNPQGTGIMRSSEFVLGGSGYISYKLGGCANQALTYLRFMMKTDDGDVEVARFSNFKYWNFQFPFVANGMKLLNLVQYYADFSFYLGKTMYIEVVDMNSSADELGCLTLDSVQTYWEEKPVWYTSESFECKLKSNVEIEQPSKYQVLNGTFETGDLTGWTTSWDKEEDRIGYVSDEDTWWQEALPYNKNGKYLFTGVSDEVKTGYLLSSPFEIGGTGFISFLFGGGKSSSLCYISILDVETQEELARYGNLEYKDLGLGLVNQGSNLLNMISYQADLSEFIGKTVQIKIVDNATKDWGLISVDSFITYYENLSDLPKGSILAKNILPSQYQLNNGGFETGDLTGWTTSWNQAELQIGHITGEDTWWVEKLPYNKEGQYLFTGLGDEGNTGYLLSSSFELAGSGWITFLLGGGKNSELCYISVLDAETEEELARYGNSEFNDLGLPLINQGSNLANMVLYRADLSSYIGRKLKFKIVDNATKDWGLVCVDDFVTYYVSESELPSKAVLAKNLLLKDTEN